MSERSWSVNAIHPQTCGKVERFHQTLKAYLAKQESPGTIEELQAQIDARDTARPAGPAIDLPRVTRVRRDRIDAGGAVTLRHAGRLHHIGVGRAHKHREVIMLVAGLDVRILTEEGEMLRHLTLDPTKIYQSIGSQKVSTMS